MRKWSCSDSRQKAGGTPSRPSLIPILLFIIQRTTAENVIYRNRERDARLRGGTSEAGHRIRPARGYYTPAAAAAADRRRRVINYSTEAITTRCLYDKYRGCRISIGNGDWQQCLIMRLPANIASL